MRVGGVPVGALVRLAREDTAPHASPSGPVVVIGPLAAQLARALAAGGDASLVVADGDPARASVVVCVLAGEPSAAQLATLRAATRRLTPVVAVQTGHAGDVPYVLATDVVDCPPGRGFPIDEIAAAIARAGGRAAAPLAARLPVLAPAVTRHLIERATVTAAALAAAPWGARAHLMPLLFVQTRLLRDVSAAAGADDPDLPVLAGVSARPEPVITLTVGLAARSLVRALPYRGAPARAIVAAGATLALGALAASRPGLRISS
jgi:hypothetical protein